MAQWRIVKRTLADGVSFHVQMKDNGGNWVGGYGIADTLEEAKEKLSNMKAYIEGSKDEVVHQE